MTEPVPRPRVRYHYYRDSQGQPRIVLAWVRLSTGAIGYGWAICSPLDQFHKKDYWEDMGDYALRRRGGNRMARERALVAIDNPKRGVQIADGVWRYKRSIGQPNALQCIHITKAHGLLHLVYHDTWTALPSDLHPVLLDTKEDASVTPP